MVASCGRPVKLLLAEGADAAALDARGRAAPHYAASAGATACAKLLIKAGAKDHPHAAGQTAAQICAAEAPEWIRDTCGKALRKAAP